MKVELEKTFPMPAGADVAWLCLRDIQAVAGCMPGATITERVDDRHFKGTVNVRVGPASMGFKGDIEVRELDEARRLLHLIGKGSDTTGTSGASMDLVASIEPGATEGTSSLVGRSEVRMTGKAAAFGGRMMGTVADQILKQFAGNFAAQVQTRASSVVTRSELSASELPKVVNGPPASDAPGPAKLPGADATYTESGSSADAAHPTNPANLTSSDSPTSPVTLAVPASPAAPARQLDAFGLLWAALRDWFRGLFRRKPA